MAHPGIYCRDMKPELLAAAFLLQRLHGTAFAAAFLEEHGVPHEQAIRIIADRPKSDWQIREKSIIPTRTD